MKSAANQTFYFGAAYDCVDAGVTSCINGKRDPSVLIELHGAFAGSPKRGPAGDEVDPLSVCHMDLDTHDYKPQC